MQQAKEKVREAMRTLEKAVHEKFQILLDDSQWRRRSAILGKPLPRDNSQPRIEMVIAETYGGKRFNAPNDLVIDKDGGIYFTDPDFGGSSRSSPPPQGKTCVYYIAPEGEVTRLIDDLPNPNGVILSPDEKTLYVIPSLQAGMMRYPITSPGKLGNGTTFCKLKQKFDGGHRGGDYLYSDADLQEWLDALAAERGRLDKALVLFNNCRNSQAAVNAGRFRELLAGMDGSLRIVPPFAAPGGTRQRELFD